MLDASFSPSRITHPGTVSRASSSCAEYELDMGSMSTRKALAEIAKALLHLSNMACLSKEEMEVRLTFTLYLFLFMN